MKCPNVDIVLECELRGDAGSTVLPLARVLPGFDEQALSRNTCRVRLSLEESARLRDVLIDLWGMVERNSGAKLLLGGESIGLDDLKNAWRVTDCAASRGEGPLDEKHCRPGHRGWDWGCLFLSHVRPGAAKNEAGPDKPGLRRSLEEEAARLRLDLCPYFDPAKMSAKVDALTDQTVASMERTPQPPSFTVLPEQSKAKADKNEPATPVASYADVGGLDEVVRTLRETIELPIKHPEILARMGIAPHKGILLHGPPGCGKTLLARAVAHESRACFIPISGPELITKWHGESEEKLRQVFAQARQSQPAIIFFDEIDAIAQSRSSDESLRLDARFTAQLLTLMDGVHDLGRVVVLAATNRPDLLDEALLRPGRFDAMIEIPRPDAEGCLKILRIHTRKLPLAKNVNLKSFARKLHGLTGADIAYVARESGYTCLRRTFSLEAVLDEAQPLSEEQLASLVVTSADLHAALRKLRNRNVRCPA